MTSLKYKHSPAFSLVEVIMGIVILSIVMMAMVSLAVTSLRANQSNIQRLTAYYLAQEGIEGLRNVRDSNWLQNYTWNEGASTPGGAAYWGNTFVAEGYYLIDYVPWSIATSASSSPWVLTYLGATALALSTETGRLHVATSLTSDAVFYLHDSTQTGLFGFSASLYRRVLAIVYPEPDQDWFEVTATVYWLDHGQEKSVAVSTLLSDWREGPI